ncbi:50S ribosomal protein L11 methyltransferase [Oligoflexaceae bacterium]|nr:50S ribosomal protein L11 methyltransferase [Oligoflexaceae bacterium]
METHEERPDLTFEMKIIFDSESHETVQVKTAVKEWLIENGVESFVEGSVDSIDIEHDYENPEVDRYASLGGEDSPISVYKFDQPLLQGLKTQMMLEFPGQFQIEIYEHDTKQWTEGWKESFRPISTEMFYIRPPWEGADESEGRHELIIDPGMAFGTGQHATTKVCLVATEALSKDANFKIGSVLDVGTGSGILGIAARKLGATEVWATDIDVDSVTSAESNAAVNEVKLDVLRGSVISHQGDGWDLIYANILSRVLKKIITELYSAVKVGGKVIMSGIIVEEVDEMKELAEGQGFKIEEVHELDGWIGLVLSK